MTVLERWDWNVEAGAGYVYVHSDLTPFRSVHLEDHDLVVDVDGEGRIIGVEVLHAANEADMLARLAAVLERCRIVD